MSRFIIVIILCGYCSALYSQAQRTRSMGIRTGFNTVTYYDESINYKVYQGSQFNPYQIHFTQNSDKTNMIFNASFLNNSLAPLKKDLLSLSDHLSLKYATIDFSYLRRVVRLGENLSVNLGAKLSAHVCEAQRTFKKNYPFSDISADRTYDLTYCSLHAISRIRYTLSSRNSLTFDMSVPFLSLNLKNFNPRLGPSLQKVWLTSFGKYSGVGSDLAFLHRYHHVAVELFQSVLLMHYASPYTRKILNSTIGLGVYYEL